MMNLYPNSGPVRGSTLLAQDFRVPPVQAPGGQGRDLLPMSGESQLALPKQRYRTFRDRYQARLGHSYWHPDSQDLLLVPAALQTEAVLAHYLLQVHAGGQGYGCRRLQKSPLSRWPRARIAVWFTTRRTRMEDGRRLTTE